MMTKLVKLTEQHIIIGLFIKAGCFVGLSIISAYNMICGWFRTIGVGGKSYKKIREAKNRHKGERCFIIATGPSLTIEDLEKIEEEYTFGMNSIIKVYEKTDFRPTYYGIQDYIVYSSLEDEINKYYRDKENVIVSDRISYHSQISKEWIKFPLNVAYNAYNRWFKNKFSTKFSDNAYKIVYDGFTITYSLIEIAVYMGFKEIYLIGADCSFNTKKALHFAEHGVIDTTIDTAQQRNLTSYEAAKRYADNYGVKIYNATRGGELEVFERVDLDTVLRNS